MISAVGVRNIVENQVDLTKSRNLIIAAVMFVSGLGFSSDRRRDLHGRRRGRHPLRSCHRGLCGVILNAVLPGNDYVFGVSVGATSPPTSAATKRDTTHPLRREAARAGPPLYPSPPPAGAARSP